MAVYSLPREFESQVPGYIAGQPNDEVEQAEAALLARLIAWAKARRPTDENAGTVVRWQVADGFAEYLVAGTEPLELLHLPMGDGYAFPLAHRATKEDILELIAREKAWAALVTRQKENR